MTGALGWVPYKARLGENEKMDEMIDAMFESCRRPARATNVADEENEDDPPDTEIDSCY